MPQIKSQMKRVKTNNKAHKLIVSKKSALKSSIKAVLAAVDAQDKDCLLYTSNRFTNAPNFSIRTTLAAYTSCLLYTSAPVEAGDEYYVNTLPIQ